MSIKKILTVVLLALILTSCTSAPSNVIVTSEVTITLVPTNTPSPTETPTPVFPPDIEVQFGMGVSQQQKSQVLSAVSNWVEYYQINEFGDPHFTLIYADVDRQNLLDKSYEQFNIIAPQSREEWDANTWSQYQGGMSMIVGEKGYIFLNLLHPYWDRAVFNNSQPTLGDCTVGNELLHLYHQWLSGINFVDAFGTNPRSPRENGPEWLLLGKEGVLCADAYDISNKMNRDKIITDLKLVPPELLLEQLTQYNPNVGDEGGYLRTAGVFYLLTESPGGIEFGTTKSLAMFFNGLAEENKTWEDVFAEIWMWTPIEFYENFEKYRQEK